MTKKLPTWSFSLVLGGVDQPTAELEDALFEAGCDDALLAFSGRVATLDFDRESKSFTEAVLSAIRDLRKVPLDLEVLRIEPDDYVNATDIAQRMNVSREAVRKWIEGERGAGDFPYPVARVGQSPVWSWWEVANWLHRAGSLDEAQVAVARITAALNRLVERKRMDEVVHEEQSLEPDLRPLMGLSKSA